MALEYLNLLIPVPPNYLCGSIHSKLHCPIKTNHTLTRKSSKIEVKYNMAVGPIRKTITVESNAVNMTEAEFL
jgi:hypothetical protein